MAISFSALMCHAPIVVPDVGRGDAGLCRRTTRAMEEIADRAVRSRPDRLVLVSPHSPRHRTAWSAWRGRHRGDLRRFRAPGVAVDLPDAPEVWQALELPETSDPDGLDHGAMVPLAFLWAAGWRGPTAVLALPWSEEGAEAIGRALVELPGRTAVIASGDMSHALEPGAPGGYHPDAARFDEAFVEALRSGDWPAAVDAPHREVAREDVVTSCTVALAAAGEAQNDEVIAYEAPWGVGYTEAVFLDPEPPLYAVARRVVRAAVTGEPFTPPAGGPGPRGAFVTLRGPGGELRGCIGHVEPVHDRLYAEIAEVGRAAALRDPRFPSVRPEELDGLAIEVSVLEPPEPISGPEQLDPRVYGVVVSAGSRRGLLLPDIDGIDTVEDQLAIARRKAGIAKGEPVRLHRFRTTTSAEP